MPSLSSTAASSTSPAISPSVVIAILWRHKVKIVALPLASLLLAIGVILYAPRTYVSEARLFLRIGRESIGLDPSATTGQIMGIQQVGRDSEVRSAIELIGSREVTGRVVDELGPEYILQGGPSSDTDDNPSALVDMAKSAIGSVTGLLKSIDPVSEREQAMIALEKSLTLGSQRNTTVINIGYETDTPVGAQTIVNRVVEVFQQEHMRIHRNSESRDFFQQQRDMFQQEVAAAQDKLRRAKNRIGVASIEARRGSLEAQVQSIDLEAYSTQQALATARARAADLSTQLVDTPQRLLASKTVIPNEGADGLRERLYTLQLREMDLKSRYKQSHPLVQTASAQVLEAKRVVDAQQANREEVTDDVNPIHRELSLDLRKLQNEVAGLFARSETLDEQRRRVVLDMERLNQHAIELQDLERAVGIAVSKRMRYEEDFEQARIDRELEDEAISSIRIAQRATLNERPASPSKTLVLLGSMMAALGLTAAWVFSSEQARVAAAARPSDDDDDAPAPRGEATSNGVDRGAMTAELSRVLH